MSVPIHTDPAAAARPEGKPQKFLTFRCATEGFAVPVGKIKEIIGMQEITAVPKTPGYVKGVLNLRGRVIPVIDLRLKLGVEAAPYDARTCIVVMEPQGARGSYYVGVVVDTVSEVIAVAEHDRQRTDEFGQGLVESEFVTGVARVRDGMTILLDIDLVLSRQEVIALTALPQMAGQGESHVA